MNILLLYLSTTTFDSLISILKFIPPSLISNLCRSHVLQPTERCADFAYEIIQIFKIGGMNTVRVFNGYDCAEIEPCVSTLIFLQMATNADAVSLLY